MKGTVYVCRDGKVVPKQEEKLIAIEPLPCLYGEYVKQLNEMLLKTYFAPREVLGGK